jgi:hypothetical protein
LGSLFDIIALIKLFNIYFLFLGGFLSNVFAAYSVSLSDEVCRNTRNEQLRRDSVRTIKNGLGIFWISAPTILSPKPDLTRLPNDESRLQRETTKAIFPLPS